MRSLIEKAVRKSPERVALIERDRSLTYKELYTKINQVAHYLSELELPKGSRIGIYSYKNIEQVISILAILSTDYIFVPISRLLKPEQVEHIIQDCKISCIITDKNKLKNIKEINYDKTIITYEAIEKDIVSFEEIFKCCTKKYDCNINSYSNACITYSFGSSGFPKGIVISHRNLIDSARVVSSYLDIQRDDVISGVLPFILDYGINQICCTIYKRATLAIHSMLLGGDFFNHILNDKVTIIPLMPIHITSMFEEKVIPHPKLLSKVRKITSSGGKITDKMIKDIEASFTNAEFYSMHGLTEAFRSTYLEPNQLKIRPESIGKAIPDVEIYVINEDGYECKPREVGELIHRGGYIYRGYWNAKEESEKFYKSIKVLKNVIDLEGDLTDEIVVCSGDYVYKDEEGYLYFVSRKDDMIKSCGFRISPYEIERVVYENLPIVNECAVFGIANEKIEEEIVLAYSASKEIAKNELLFELKKHLPNHMIPSRIFYKQKLPKISPNSDKIDKDAIKKEVLEVV
jgi:acyl-coenzyme A synthetase/AMP-(fatty) acid ligase